MVSYGDVLYSWVGRTNFTYKTSFVLSHEDMLLAKNAILVLEGVETNATIRVNGNIVGVVDDEWLQYELPVSKVLVEGMNTLEVVFASLYDACRFTDPGLHNLLV